MSLHRLRCLEVRSAALLLPAPCPDREL